MNELTECDHDYSCSLACDYSTRVVITLGRQKLINGPLAPESAL